MRNHRVVLLSLFPAAVLAADIPALSVAASRVVEVCSVSTISGAACSGGFIVRTGKVVSVLHGTPAGIYYVNGIPAEGVQCLPGNILLLDAETGPYQEPVTAKARSGSRAYLLHLCGINKVRARKVSVVSFTAERIDADGNPAPLVIGSVLVDEAGAFLGLQDGFSFREGKPLARVIPAQKIAALRELERNE